MSAIDPEIPGPALARVRRLHRAQSYLRVLKGRRRLRVAARTIGVSPSLLSQWARGHCAPSPHQLAKLRLLAQRCD
jgi:DNA-binding transcriptional regulator YiaG